MLGASILVSLATVLVSGINFLAQVVLAWKFGATSSMDIYLIAISVPMFISGVLSVGLSYSLVPALLSYERQGHSYRQFSGLLFLGFLFMAAIIAGLGYLVTPWQIHIFGPLLSKLQVAEAVSVARISWVTAGVMVLIAYLRGLQNSQQHFLFPAFAIAVPSLCVIFAGLLTTASVRPDCIAWAMLLGFVILVPVLLISSYTYMDLSSRSFQALPGVKNYLFQLPLIVLAVLCFTAFQASDSYWAPQLGEGRLAHLSYCQRLVVSIGNLVIAGPAAVVLPRLSNAHVEGRAQDLLADSERVIRLVLACCLPVAVYVSVVAEPAISLLFERGAFTQQDTREVADLLPWMMIGMVPMLCVVMIFRAIFARQEILWAAGIGCLTSALYFGLSGWLSDSFGALGIAIAYAGTWWIVFLISLCALWRGRLRQLTHRTNVGFIGKLVLALAVTGSIGFISNDWFIQSNASSSTLIFRLVVVALASAVCYIGLAIFIRIDEIRLLLSFLRQNLGPRLKLFKHGKS